MELVTEMMEWENGVLDEDETVALFQELINTGTIYALQGMYGRQAQRLINAGLIHA